MLSENLCKEIIDRPRNGSSRVSKWHCYPGIWSYWSLYHWSKIEIQQKATATIAATLLAVKILGILKMCLISVREIDLCGNVHTVLEIICVYVFVTIPPLLYLFILYFLQSHPFHLAPNKKLLLFCTIIWAVSQPSCCHVPSLLSVFVILFLEFIILPFLFPWVFTYVSYLAFHYLCMVSFSTFHSPIVLQSMLIVIFHSQSLCSHYFGLLSVHFRVPGCFTSRLLLSRPDLSLYISLVYITNLTNLTNIVDFDHLY